MTDASTHTTFAAERSFGRTGLRTAIQAIVASYVWAQDIRRVYARSGPAGLTPTLTGGPAS